ncbi:DUF1080 domain-containing protein [Salegentibacter sp. BDJ18]|uniref:3-keto-disaccharide hydrolase n=1 Tax=Salegentibacter sp. BDJ18 TaxID=2816376 RepID=UPI001AAFAEB6|nr:DUF1080 domain-containing protein [Salegentibacter sp. BDJ18]MBO2543587.1 DUF1080 domain-containing protein [Salegentibacter sp. BDJ18]
MKNEIQFHKFSAILIFATAFICFGCASKNLPKWQQLFNGEDIDNWRVKLRGHELGDNFANTFKVQDGILQIRYDEYGNGFDSKFGHIFYEKPFSSYLIGVEYRFVGDQVKNNPGAWAYRNNGIMIHGQDPETMERDQDFPNSIEVQLLGGNGKNERPTVNLCTPGTQFVMNGELIKIHCTNSTSKTFPGDQWVRAEVLVLRDSLIVHYVNGEEVMRYEKPQTDDGKLLDRGTISLQSESHPTDFRKVEIVDLEKYKNDPEKLHTVVEKLMAEKKIKSRS